MKFTLLIAALMVFVSALADDAGQTVRCHEIAFSKSAEARDATMFASFVDADARFVGSSVMRGSVAIAEAWSAFFPSMDRKSSGALNSWKSLMTASWP